MRVRRDAGLTIAHPMPTRSLRSRLLLLIAAFMLPTLAAAAAAIWYIADQKQQQFELGLREATRALSLVVEQELSRREAIARTLAESPALDRGDFAAFHQYALQIAPTQDRVVVLSAPDGQQLVNTRRPYGSPLPKARTPGNASSDPNAAMVSDIYFAPIGKAYSFAVHVPIVRNGQVAYYISYASYVSLLQSLFEKQPLPNGWVAQILDRQGVVAARNRDPARFVGQPATERLRSRLAQAGSGLYESISADGDPILASYYRDPVHGWSVALGVPLSDFAAAQRAAAAFGFFAVAALLAALFGALWFARGLLTPVAQLADAARAMGQGRHVEAVRTGVAELDVISAVLGESSRNLQVAREGMEVRVREALAEADKAQRVVVQNQRLEALGQLTGGVAHDFNNLLMIVGNYVHLLRRSVPGLADHAHLQGIERAVQTGSRLTRQLLAFARRQPLRPELLDIAERLPELAGLVKASVGGSIRVEHEVAPGVPPIHADPAEFELAIINLAVNSRDAMPSGGELRLRASPAVLGDGRPATCIEVTDTGTGMPPHVAQRVFEPFFTTKAVGQGTGLGLSQVYGFVQQAGGQVGIDTAPGRGTTVRVVLPAADPAALQPAQAAAEVAPNVPGRGSRVLLVEDNEGLARPTAELLQDAGYEVTLAASGDEALALLRDGAPFEMVLSDVRMPGQQDGIALARWIREERPGLPVVLMTGYTSELQQAEALDVPVLAKPTPAGALLRAVADAIQ
jgi:signal transduction histidine kinase